MEQEKQQISKEKIRKLERELLDLNPSWPQIKARWMAVKLLLPPQEEK